MRTLAAQAQCPMSTKGAADDFRKQIMNLVLQLGPLTLEPKLANAVEIEIRDVLNTLGIGTDPRSGVDAANRRENLTSYLRIHDEISVSVSDSTDRERKAHSRIPEAEDKEAIGGGSQEGWV